MSKKKKSRKQLLDEIATAYARLGGRENTVTSILYLALDGTLLLINKVGAGNLDGEPSDFVGRSISEIFPQKADVTIERIGRAVESGVGAKFIDFVELPSGERWFLTDFQPVKDANGKTIAVQLVSIDVTEWRVAEERADLLTKVVEQSSEGIGVVNMDGYLLFANDAMAAMHGYSPQEMLGKHLSICHLPEQMPAVIASLKQLREMGEFEGEIWHARRDGSVFPSLMHYTVLHDESGAEIGIIGTMRDITDYKHAEEALRQSEQEKALILGSLSELISYQDKSLKIVWANEAAGDSVGQRPDELVGRYCYEVWHGRQEPCRDCPVAKSIESGQPHEGEITSPDGRIWYMRSSPVLNEQGDVVGAVEATLDITQRKQAEAKLRESEARYRMVVEDQTELICRFMPEGVLTFVNDAYCRYFGRKREELIGHSFMLLIPEEDREEVKNQIAKLNRENSTVTTEHRVITEGDSIRWQQWTNRAIFDEQGNIIEYQAVGRDVTEHLEAEAKLRESESRFRTVLEDLSNVAVQGYGPDGTIRYWNKTNELIYGYTAEEAIGKNIADLLLAPENRDEYRKSIAETARTGKLPPASEFVVMHKDGTPIPIYSSHSLVRGPDGEPEIFCVDIDLRLLKQAEQELQMRDKAIESSISAIAIADSEGVLTYVNSAFLRMWGYGDIEEVVGRGTIEFWQHKDKAVKAMEVSRVEGSWKGELTGRGKDGSEFEVQVLASRVKGDAGKPDYMMASFVDITDRKRIGRELAVHHEKMRRAEQLASLGMVSATVAHELNQPLTVMRLFLQQGLRALKDDNDGDKVAEVIDDCLSELTKAAGIVDRFRRFARKSAPVYIAKVNLVEVANGIVGILAESARREKLHLSVTVESCPPYIIGNSLELEQMFFVLIQNAIQAADGEAWRELAISISSQGDELLLTFADTCGGIRKEDIDKIFEPFFTTKPANLGTGLGLSILERIVKRHGGSVRVKSRIGRGTFFYICLPIKS